MFKLIALAGEEFGVGNSLCAFLLLICTACIVRGAYAGVIQSTAKIYKRPGLLAETNQQFELMDIVAVEEER